MPAGPRRLAVARCVALILTIVPQARCAPAATWRGVLRDESGHMISHADLVLQAVSDDRKYTAKSSATGNFVFAEIAAGTYTLRVAAAGKTWNSANPMVIKEGAALVASLQLDAQDQIVRVLPGGETSASQGSGGEHLSSGELSSLPLNERDFSKLLLLAAGTMTDTNGAANFTQQFAVNGQRGVASVFAIDGAEFRTEFFNIFNIVDFGLPSNTVLGTGFGIISHTAGPSRQIQFSLKLIY
jgi:hypothetical protein